jgi:hypothetical protein
MNLFLNDSFFSKAVEPILNVARALFACDDVSLKFFSSIEGPCSPFKELGKYSLLCYTVLG